MILQKLVVGPLTTNCYIVGSEKTKEAMVIDPADEADRIHDPMTLTFCLYRQKPLFSLTPRRRLPTDCSTMVIAWQSATCVSR